MPQRDSVKAPDITTELFGGVFDIDGAGHYPGLELINFVVCCPDGILPNVTEVRLTRVAHDFARRLIRDDKQTDRRRVLIDSHSEDAVSRLLRCLELDVVNIVKAKGWERTHFFPYTRSLVHWDARMRGSSGEVRLERRYLRGGGAYAFHVLRSDPNIARLEANRTGLGVLYPASGDSPLESLAATLRAQGSMDPRPVVDQLEGNSRLAADDWEDLFRDGVANILSHTSIPAVQRVRALVNWTGIWLMLMEVARAAKYTGSDYGGLILDCAGTHPQLRRASQKCLKDQLANVEEAARRKAAASEGTISGQQLGKIKGFVANTAAACGLLNSWKGRRHFLLKLDAIETLVLAAVPSGSELPLEGFVSEWLYARCRLVVGRQAASQAGLLTSFDATIFEENERRLAEQMLAAGVMRVYSDATRMVSPGAAQ